MPRPRTRGLPYPLKRIASHLYPARIDATPQKPARIAEPRLSVRPGAKQRQPETLEGALASARKRARVPVYRRQPLATDELRVLDTERPQELAHILRMGQSSPPPSRSV